MESPVYHHIGAGQAHSVVPVDLTPDASKGHSNRERGRYKEKFQAMREKYEKATRQQEVYQKQLDVANAKIKKLEAEHNLLLDSMLVNDDGLYNRFFPVSQLERPTGPNEIHRRSPPPPAHVNPIPLRRSRRISNAMPMNGNGHIPLDNNPLPHSNGNREPSRQPPEQHTAPVVRNHYERPLEFIVHDSNGRI